MALTHAGLTQAIEAAFVVEYQAARGSPPAAMGAEDRRILFAAVARGVLTYLEAQGSGALASLEVREGTVARTLQVTRTAWSITV
jgi:hypothetical protein